MEPTDQKLDREYEFLLKEYEHWSQSLLQSEEAGERRLNFFVTIVGGAFAVIGFLVTHGSSTSGATKLHHVVGLAALVLFALGVLTLARLVKRDASTDLCIFQLNKLRRILLPEARANEIDPDESKVKPRRRPITNGGLAHMAAIINAALFALLAWALFAIAAAALAKSSAPEAATAASATPAASASSGAQLEQATSTAIAYVDWWPLFAFAFAFSAQFAFLDRLRRKAPERSLDTKEPHKP